jgi:DNA-binding IclR family transcriptional regulator
MNPDRYIRIFDVINLLVQHKEGLRLTEIKSELNLPVSSVHNMLQAMIDAELATVNEDLRYSVGPRAVALALRTLQSLDIRSVARRHLQDLVKEIGDDVYLAIKIGNRVIYADRCLGTQRISLDIRLGESLFLHSTATGKLFAALDAKLGAHAMLSKFVKITPNTISNAKDLELEFQRIRLQGYAKSNGESMEGIQGYSVPIYDGAGVLTAALHVSVLQKRATKSHERKLLDCASACAEQIERQLGNYDQRTKRVAKLRPTEAAGNSKSRTMHRIAP